MIKRNKIIWLVALFIIVLFSWQTWNKTSLNDLFGKPLIVRQPLAEAQVAIVHACGFGPLGQLSVCAKERVDWAFKLWQEKIFPQFILSGGLVKNGYTESAAMGRYLEQLGVPPSNLFLEDKSSNTWENVLYSLEILKQHNWSKVLIVTSPFHSGRAYLIWQKVCPVCELESYPPLASWVTQPGLVNRWRGLRSVVREYLALIYYKLRSRI